MKKSLKRKMAIVFIGLVVMILLVSLLINGQFLGKYYIADKQAKLVNLYEEIENAVRRGDLKSEDTIDELNKLVEVGNISFVVMLAQDRNQNVLTATHGTRRTEELMVQLMNYMTNQNQGNSTLLKKSNSYQIHSSRDHVTDEEYIEMWGVLSDGSSFLLRTPLESIRDNVALSNTFLTYIMIALILLSSVLVWYFSKRITDPILELAELSEKMADLDFEAKYVRGGTDEIGVLGQNFNVMSDKLQETISELKNANYELKKDIEKKEKIESMRTEFLANVSHELKTPLALIQGYAEGLRDGISDDPESRAFYCDVIMDEAAKMNQMVKNLLTLQQVEFGDEEVVFERFDIIELICGVIQSCEILIHQKETDVRFYYNQPFWVWGDEFKVEQVIRNYFSNALNHVAEENIIDIKLIPNVEQNKVRISVFNTGKQIPEEDLERIWDKFYKVDKARTREYGGNGIGLSIVKAIMESFQQKYGVENYKNGVAFWFELDTK